MFSIVGDSLILIEVSFRCIHNLQMRSQLPKMGKQHKSAQDDGSPTSI